MAAGIIIHMKVVLINNFYMIIRSRFRYEFQKLKYQLIMLVIYVDT
jgi:hypothetical protein